MLDTDFKRSFSFAAFAVVCQLCNFLPVKWRAMKDQSS
jgi:hypothetical protein